MFEEIMAKSFFPKFDENYKSTDPNVLRHPAIWSSFWKTVTKRTSLKHPEQKGTFCTKEQR